MGWFWLVAITVVCWQLMNENTIWAFVSDAPDQAADIGGRMFPPAWGYINNLWEPLWDTINIATLGTLLGILFAIPVAFLAGIVAIGLRSIGFIAKLLYEAIEEIDEKQVEAGWGYSSTPP